MTVERLDLCRSKFDAATSELLNELALTWDGGKIQTKATCMYLRHVKKHAGHD
jgi:hypothetical protein